MSAATSPSVDTLKCLAWKSEYERAVEARRAALSVVSNVVPAIAQRVEVERESLRARAERERLGAFSRSVLVLDDNEDCLGLCAAAIEIGLGVKVYTATTPSEARSLWYAHLCGVVIADVFLGLPETGDMVLRALPPGVRKILLSGWSDSFTLGSLARNVHAVAIRKPADNLVSIVRGLLDDVLPPYWCHTDDERLMVVSPDLAKLLGYPVHLLVGVPWRRLVVEADHEASAAVVAGNLSSGQGVDGFVNRWRCADGSTVRLSWECSPLTEGRFHCLARRV